MASRAIHGDIFDRAKSISLGINSSTPTILPKSMDLDPPLISAEQQLLRDAWLQFKVIVVRTSSNDAGIWDNRFAEHYAVSDYWAQHRVLERVTVYKDNVEK